MVEVNLDQVVELARWGRGTSSDLAWSPDGRWLAIASRLGVFLYDPADLTEKGRIPVWDARQIAFTTDGDYLAVAGDALELWQVEPIQKRSSWLSQAAKGALDLRFDAGDARLAVVGVDEQGLGTRLEVWNVAQETLVSEYSLGGPGSRITTGVLSPDLSLAAVHGRGLIQLYRLVDGAQYATLPISASAPGPMAFSPDSSRLAVAYPDQRRDYRNENQVQVFRIADGSVDSTLFPAGGLEGATEELLSLDFSPDGRSIAGGYANRVVRVWSSEGGAARSTLTGVASTARITFSPDSSQIASSGIDLWEVSGAQLMRSADQHFEPYQDMALSPSGAVVALAGYSQVELRSVSDGSLVRTIDGLPGPVRSISFYPGGQTLAAAGGDGLLRLYRVSDGRFLSTLGEIGPPLWSVAFSDNGNWLAWGGEGQTIYFYDLVKDQLAFKIDEPFLPIRLEFSPVNSILASLTSNGLNLRTLDGVLIRSIGGAGLEDMAFWLDGSQVALAGNQVCRVVDLETGEEVVTLDYRPEDSPSAVAYSDDGAFLAVGWRSGLIELYWAGTKDLLRALEGHRGPVERLLFTAGNQLLLSSGQDGTIRAWGVTP